MERRVNPFHELYVTESINERTFVQLFSNVLIEHTSALFKPGNVILKGLPGTGKSMMLNLLKPSVRLEYHKSNVPFPIPDKLNKFIGAGINLIRSSISDFGQRPIRDGKDQSSLEELSIYFGDFLNYWVVKDILQSVTELAGELGNEIGIDLHKDKCQQFVDKIRQNECWFGYLDDIGSFDDLIKRIKNRITTYRSFLNYNIDELPKDIVKSKTNIGIPIATISDVLKECGIIKEEVNIFIRIDQFEELAWLDESINGMGKAYQSVIYKLLAMRDSSVSYRIGTRPFAWDDEHQQILGTTAKLEHLRNYGIVSIDEVLKKSENKRTYLFPLFAEDIFARRLKISQYIIDNQKDDLLKMVFSNGLDSSEKALKYVKSSREKAIELEDWWPDDWKNFLKDLAQQDPLSARLGEAWARQKGKEDIVLKKQLVKPYPWDKKKYWIKERNTHALIQIASRNSQQLIWEGKDDLLTLSGGNILAFLSLCQQIWEVWMRDKKNRNYNLSLPSIDIDIQTLGILEASSKWYEKITSEKGGRERKKLITFLGVEFYKRLTEDKAMSYPGNNGFSIAVDELEENPKIFKFLKDASDYGDLYDKPHTTKSKDGKKRIKWYLAPILSPYFKIPASHIKEPIYLKIDQIYDWLIKSGAFNETPALGSKKKTKLIKNNLPNNPDQGSLF